MPAAAPAKPAFDLKSTAWTLTALRLQVADLATLVAALDERFADSPGLFDNDPVAIDLSPLRDSAAPVDIAGLLPHLRRHGMLPIAAQGGNPAQMAAARAAGLAEAPDAPTGATARAEAAAAPRDLVREVPVIQEVVREVVREVEVIREVVKEVPAAGGVAPAMVVDKPLRSGQRVYARGGDLVVLAVVSFGAEVIADGSIHVYAPLRGRAIAGARGDTSARIFSTCLEPQLVSIAGIYRTTETPLPDNVRGRPAQVRLDGEKIYVEPLDA
jgi:septum site-determining protein MinC